jgi:hypothetical protein
MILTPAHKELIKLLAAAAVEEFLEEQENPMPTVERIPIEKFYFDLLRNAFIYRPTGRVWKAAGVNAVVGRVEGMKATEWLKLYAVRR